MTFPDSLYCTPLPYVGALNECPSPPLKDRRCSFLSIEELEQLFSDEALLLPVLGREEEVDSNNQDSMSSLTLGIRRRSALVDAALDSMRSLNSQKEDEGSSEDSSSSEDEDDYFSSNEEETGEEESDEESVEDGNVVVTQEKALEQLKDLSLEDNSDIRKARRRRSTSTVDQAGLARVGSSSSLVGLTRSGSSSSLTGLARVGSSNSLVGLATQRVRSFTNLLQIA